jgi:hypothetical protein
LGWRAGRPQTCRHHANHCGAITGFSRRSRAAGLAWCPGGWRARPRGRPRSARRSGAGDRRRRESATAADRPHPWRPSGVGFTIRSAPNQGCHSCPSLITYAADSLNRFARRRAKPAVMRSLARDGPGAGIALCLRALSQR